MSTARTDIRLTADGTLPTARRRACDAEVESARRAVRTPPCRFHSEGSFLPFASSRFCRRNKGPISPSRRKSNNLRVQARSRALSWFIEPTIAIHNRAFVPPCSEARNYRSPSFFPRRDSAACLSSQLYKRSLLLAGTRLA